LSRSLVIADSAVDVLSAQVAQAGAAGGALRSSLILQLLSRP
jgi:hypothetical protein